MITAYRAREIFDGEVFHANAALLVTNGQCVGITPEQDIPPQYQRHESISDLIVPGFVDLQVNGGGGVQFNNDPSLEGIETICAAHARYGTTALMVTLITDTADIREHAVEASKAAWQAKTLGYLGLHLEGPHLDRKRKGAHDENLIRPLTKRDLDFLISHTGHFGQSLMTVAPESLTPSDVKILVDAGYCISLGHTNCSGETASAYFAAGASMATHLFNAMSQLTNREPGLVGTALATPNINCSIIADGHHVAQTSLKVALNAKRDDGDDTEDKSAGKLFLITDAMAPTGTDATDFILNGRSIYRREGRLTLADGTLAGADIDMLSSVRFAIEQLSLPREEALRMASLYSARAIQVDHKGHLTPKADADFLCLNKDFTLNSTWIGGQCFYDASQ